jgi:hypothetical protein
MNDQCVIQVHDINIQEGFFNRKINFPYLPSHMVKQAVAGPLFAHQASPSSPIVKVSKFRQVKIKN